ncbi:MAG: CBS domain-containing protein [Halanaerobiaceae bacterium]
MVTMTDIQKVDPARYSSTPVKQIMSREIKEVRPRDDVYRAFKLLFQQDIGRLVVQEDGRLKGIITRSDILKAFRIKQLEERGIRMQ